MNIDSTQDRQANSLVINTGDRSLETGGRSPDPKLGLESEAWPDAVPGDLLLCDIAKLLRRFVVLPKWAEETLALWILHTYAFELRDVTTYVGVESPEKRCGKTTLLTILSELVSRPVVAANISSSAFFRVIEEVRPTLLIDEADTFLQGNDELRGILNSGYKKRTAFVVRVTNEATEGRVDQWNIGRIDRSDGGSRLARFSCWCPKVMAAIGRLPDTLADRCIVMRMQRKTAAEGCERLRNLDTMAIRRQCARFVLDNAEAIANARPEIPEGLNDRAADIWEPLFVLADLAGDFWARVARQAAVALASSANDANPISSLLLDIAIGFIVGHNERMFSRTLVEHLNSRSEHRPWAERRNGKPITDLWLAQQLRPYGIRPRMIWVQDEQGRGYCREDFQETFDRYIVKAEAKAYLDELRRPAELNQKDEGQRDEAGG